MKKRSKNLELAQELFFNTTAKQLNLKTIEDSIFTARFIELLKEKM
jgi:hypothetical protein